MRRFMTKVLVTVLTVMMFIGNSTVLAVEPDLSGVSSARPVAYGQRVHVELPAGVAGRWYSFTPSDTGYYNFSTCEKYSPKICVYDSELNLVVNDNGQFYINGVGMNVMLIGGKTYYLWLTTISDTPSSYHSYDFSIAWTGRILTRINIDGSESNTDYADLDYSTQSDIVLSVSPPDGEDYSYKWYKISSLGDRVEISGATGSSFTVDGRSYVYECDVILGGIARSVRFRLYWENSPAIISSDCPAFSLGDAGTVSTVVVPAFTGREDLHYIAFPDYYEKTFKYLLDTDYPWSSSTTLELPPLNVTTVDYYGVIDDYPDRSFLAKRNMLVAFVRTESNSGPIILDETNETVLSYFPYVAGDYAPNDSEVSRYPDCYIYSYTPEASGTYTVSSSDISAGDPFVAVFDDGYHLISTADNLNGSFFWQDGVTGDKNFTLPLHLEGGKTYYYVVWSHNLNRDGGTERVFQFNVTLTCDELDTFSVNVTSSGHGTADASVSAGICGTQVDLTATPDSGYRFTSWEVVSGGVTVSNNSFTIGNSDVEIRANFEAIPTQAPSTPAPTASIPTPTIPSANNAPVSETGVAGFVERLYTIALGRASDPVGKQDWIDAITLRGETGASCARGFLYSPEFLNKGVSNEEFVAVLYRTFFNREPDQAGFNAWVGVLNNGTSKEEVIEGFINSTEWANLCLFYGIRNGGTGVPSIEIEPNQATIDFATRLYTTCLNRSADENGLMAWARQLANQRDTGTGAARGFFFSSEFTGQNVTNGEYVTRLYRTFMNREPDQAGYDAWVGQLDSGVSREEVFDGFAESIEFARICASYGIVR